MRYLTFLLLSFVVFFSISNAYTQNVNKGLIARYLFNGDVTDASKNNNDGKEYGGLEYVDDRFGNACGALSFNGIDGYVEVPTSKSLESPLDELTVAVWVKLDPFSDGLKWVTIICKSNISQETYSSPQYRVQGTRVTLSVNTEFTENLKLNMQVDKWYHYVVTYDGGEVRAYLDGKMFFSFWYSGNFYPNKMPLEIGRDVPGALEYFHGAYDDLRIYNRSLSDREIQKLFKDNSERNSPKPCVDKPLPPEVLISSPAKQRSESQVEDVEIKATVKHVTKAKDITFRVNGKKNINFAYDPQTDDFLSKISLIPGKNYIEIQGENSVGEDEKSVVIEYVPPVPVGNPPEVIIISPYSDPFNTKKSNHNLVANIKYVDTKKDIQFKLNGVLTRKFEFDPITGDLNTTLDLNPGQNVFEIIAKNDFGEDDKNGRIIFKQRQPQPPVVEITLPQNNPYKSSKKDVVIKASIKYISDKNDIRFSVNGATTKSFEFDKSRNSFEATVSLIEGNNYVEIFAKNLDGNDKDASVILFEQQAVGQPPKITIIYPNKQPMTVEKQDQKIEATVEYVESKGDINFIINGATAKDFRYDAKTKKFVSNQSLILGYNHFEIIATNKVGQDEKSGGIIYKKSEDQPLKPSPPLPDVGKVIVKKKVKLRSSNIKLVCYDHKKQDGDIVSVILNDKVLVDKQELKSLGKGEIVLNLPPFQKGEEYILISKAWNLGEIPPNTMTIRIYEDSTLKETIVLESDIGKSEAIKLVFR